MLRETRDRASGATSLALPSTTGLVRVLAVPVVLFGLLNLAMAGLIAVHGEGALVEKLSLDGEATVPAFYNALLLLVVASLLALNALVAHRGRDRHAWRWAVLCLAAASMSVDEASGIHEIVGERFGALLPDEDLPYNSWVFLGGALVLALGVTTLPLLRTLPRRTTWSLVAAAVLYVGGAIGMELAAEPSALASQWRGPLYFLLMTTEEVLEMVALLVAVAALYDRLTGAGRSELRLATDADPYPDESAADGGPELSRPGAAATDPRPSPRG